MTPGVLPRHGPLRAQLLVVDGRGRITHHAAADLPRFVRRGDLIVANDAATLPASLAATHVRTGQPVEIRLAGRRSLAPDAVGAFTVVVFGTGDYRMPTERRPTPPTLAVGDTLVVGPLRATVTAVHDHPRLVDIRFHDGVDEIWAALARHGRPIQYSYIQEPLAIWDTWTSIASQPVAFEAPSAGFILDWSMLRALRARHARVASLTHAAGISSTGDPDLDRVLPLDEPYVIPPATAALVNRTKQCGGRVLAVGTTVVRALEHAARDMGDVSSGGGVATGRIGAHTRLLIVDGLVSGMHEPGTSHYELLRAFQEDNALAKMAAEAEKHEYRGHEFGDAVFIERFAGINARVWNPHQHGNSTDYRNSALPSLHARQRQRFFDSLDGQLDRITHVPTGGIDFTAVDRACRERERLANDLPFDDVRGLLSDHQSTCDALPLDLKLEHKRVSRHGGALPTAIPRIAGVLERVTGRTEDQDRRDCESTLHLDTSFASHRQASTAGSSFENLATDCARARPQ